MEENNNAKILYHGSRGGIVGDIKPLAPKQTQKRDDELIANIPKVKVI